MMSPNGSQMPVITSDKRELRRCTLHLWPNYNGLGLILKYSTQTAQTTTGAGGAVKIIPHMIKQVEVDSPAFYAGVLANDYIIKVGQRNAETEKFDTVLKWIKEQLKKEKKCELLLLNSTYYDEFMRKHMNTSGKVDFNSPVVQSQIKHYQSPLFNPNVGTRQYGTGSATATINLDQPPEARLCHLLTWSFYDGYGFYTTYNADGCFIRNVEPNSPAQLGGLRDYDRILEINGKQVNARDRDFVVKQINKHKKATSDKATLKSQSAYSMGGGSVGTTKSNKSVSSSSQAGSTSGPGQNYLYVLVADPITYKWYTQRKIELSSRNKNMRIQNCFTPPENSLKQLMSANPVAGASTSTTNSSDQRPDINTIRTNQSGVSTVSRVQGEIPRNLIMKKCIIRKLKGKESEPLGFEMTKLGNSPNYVSRVEPGSAAALSSLCVDDYLIELNDRNIEDMDNDFLKQSIYHHLEPKNGGEIAFTTLNKPGYDYCVQNGIKPGNFIEINRGMIQTYETPRDRTAYSSIEPPSTTSIPPQPPQQPPPPVVVPPTPSRENKSTSTREDLTIIEGTDTSIRGGELPRVCILRKTNRNEELGFSIARIKDLKEHVINDVVPGSLADRAGLRPNDCLLEVNGENVENKSHLETVKKISELKQLNNVDINLLVVQKEHLNIQNSLTHSKLNKTSSMSTPDLFTSGGDSGSSPGIVTVVNKNMASSSRSQSTKRLDQVGLSEPPPITPTPTPSTAATTPSRSINHYPDVKVCEFIGYPRGTQLGLVVTSDDYSHDVVKVAEGSPADQCGIVKGDVIIAVNDINIEGQPSSIELLNEFDESQPLKILVASRYAYEWSKLLKIRIAERDWPNIKKTSTRHVMSSTVTTTTTTRQQAVANNYYEPANAISTNNLSNGYGNNSPNDQYQQQPPIYAVNNQQQFNRAASANASYNDLHTQVRPIATSTTPRKAGTSSSYYINNNRPATSGTDYWRSPRQNIQHIGTLGRSAVDITADGRVLRLCTLELNPNSPNITDSEFGFDLVTKIGSGPASTNRVSDYYIDTIDENSPASRSGLRPGDRLIEVDGLDVTVRTFEQVVQLINEAKHRCRLKLLVYPSAILNYGNPEIARPVYNMQPQSIPIHGTTSSIQSVDSKSMPDLTLQQQFQQQSYYGNQLPPYQDRTGSTKTMYKQQRRHIVTTNKYPLNPNQVANDYDSIYLKNQRQNNSINGNLNSHLSKSSSNLYNGGGGTLTTASTTSSSYRSPGGSMESSLRPVPRLCTIYKSDHSANIGFGITTKPPHGLNYATVIPPQYMRVTIVNYKSPAYLSGLEAGDIIIEVNGRSTLQMTPDDTLHYIKSSYEVNSMVKLLVVSEFCYQWLYENDQLGTLFSDHRSVFSYSDYLKNNHRYVPRLCKIKLFPFSKSFGFSVDSILLTQPTTSGRTGVKPAYAHMIMRVDRDSPAYTSSLLKGDRIIECDGINVEHENEQQITERIYQSFVVHKQITLFVVDPDTDNFFKAKCIKLHSFLPIVQSITNSTDI